MGRTKVGGKSSSPPPLTPEDQENEMINLAVNLARQKLIDGTASNSIITHYLRLATTKEQIEKDILEEQKKLIEAKTQNLQSAARIEELYSEALNAMRGYQGKPVEDEDGY